MMLIFGSWAAVRSALTLGLRWCRARQLALLPAALALALLVVSLSSAARAQTAQPVVPKGERDAIVGAARAGLETHDTHSKDIEREQAARTQGETQLGTRLDQNKEETDQAKRVGIAAKAQSEAAQGDAAEAKRLSTEAKQIAERAAADNRDNKDFVDRFWVLLAAVLVFFMQAGFKCLEVGLGRQRFDTSTGLMNLMNWLILCALFYFSYNLMFGRSSGGWLSVDVLRLLDERTYACQAQASCQSGQHLLDLTDKGLGKLCCNSQLGVLYYPLGLEHFLFQLAFAATTATIVDGAIAERTQLFSYTLVVVGVGLFVYPLFGHWAWNPDGWLRLKWWSGLAHRSGKQLAFHDFAGSTVVHSVGAWISLVGVHYIGPRRFQRFSDDDPPLVPWSRGYAVLGVMMLWFGWWGFNGGSKLTYDKSIAGIILNTNLAGAFAGLTAYAHAAASKRSVPDKIIGGVLGGLVAITASCDVMPPWGAMLVGSSAGLVHNLAFERLKRAKLDDVAGAIPVHGACGVWGTFLAGFAAIPGTDGAPASFNWYQPLVQMLGIVTAFVFASVSAAILFKLVDVIAGLRSSIADDPHAADLDSTQAAPNLRYDEEYGISFRRRVGWSPFRSLRAHLKSAPSTSEALVADIKRGAIEVIRGNGTRVTSKDELRLVTQGRHYFYICYRHKDPVAATSARVLKEKEKLLTRPAFLDGAQLVVGQSFPERLQAALDACNVLIVIIGPDWNRGNWLKDENDWVRHEIREALKRPDDVVVAPILVGGAAMPLADELPEELRELPHRHLLIWDPPTHEADYICQELSKLVQPYAVERDSVTFRGSTSWGIPFGGMVRLVVGP